MTSQGGEAPGRLKPCWVDSAPEPAAHPPCAPTLLSPGPEGGVHSVTQDTALIGVLHVSIFSLCSHPDGLDPDLLSPPPSGSISMRARGPWAPEEPDLLKHTTGAPGRLPATSPATLTLNPVLLPPGSSCDLPEHIKLSHRVTHAASSI